MTIDEAIRHCEEVAEKQDKLCEISVTERAKEQNSKCASEHRQLAEWLKELKAYKEQDSDAISRQIISDYVGSHIQEINTGYGDINKHTNEILRMIVDYIESMPPVTPKQKIGRWIRMKAYEKWGCSECNAVFRFTFKEHDYCPNCGCAMKGELE